MTDLRDDVREAFRERFGHKPVGIWSAPGRVNLIGEHTDYNEGFVLPFAIDRRTLVAAGPRDDGILRVGSTFAGDELFTEIAIAELDELRERGGLDGDWSQYPLGVAWALGEPLADGGGGADLAGRARPRPDDRLERAGRRRAVVVGRHRVRRRPRARTSSGGSGSRSPTSPASASVPRTTSSAPRPASWTRPASLLGKRDSAVFLDCRSLETEIVPLGFADGRPRARSSSTPASSTRTRPAATPSAAPRASGPRC